jgi:hypothetical protein
VRTWKALRGGETVWEYINPVRGGLHHDLIPVLSLGMTHVAPNLLDPSFLEVVNQPKSP